MSPPYRVSKIEVTPRVLTRQTKEQILAHNEAGAKLCGWTR
jgi:hypothetical protein